MARQEAVVAARFRLLHDGLATGAGLEDQAAGFLPLLERTFRREQYRDQLARLREELQRAAARDRHRELGSELRQVVDAIAEAMDGRAAKHFGPLAVRKSDFFRDLAGADYMALAERHAEPDGIDFELLSGLFDRAILRVENSAPTSIGARSSSAGRWMPPWRPRGRATAAPARRCRGAGGAGARHRARGDRLRVGTGYGRAAPAVPQGADPLARSCATAWARTSCSRRRAPCWTSAARTPRRSRSTSTASSPASR